MNKDITLREFINHRTTCPLCKSELFITFQSARKQIVKFDDNRLQIQLTMSPLYSKDKTYLVTYSFGLDDNSFKIEFNSTKNVIIDIVYLSLLKRFKEMNKNFGICDYRMFKRCTYCKKYNYYSSSFNFDLKKSTFSPIRIDFERFTISSFSKNLEYYLTNSYNSHSTRIDYYKPAFDMPVPNFINVPLMKFSTPLKMANRIDKIMIFS